MWSGIRLTAIIVSHSSRNTVIFPLWNVPDVTGIFSPDEKGSDNVKSFKLCRMEKKFGRSWYVAGGTLIQIIRIVPKRNGE